MNLVNIVSGSFENAGINDSSKLLKRFSGRNSVGLFKGEEGVYVIKLFRDRPIIDRIRRLTEKRSTGIAASLDKHSRYSAEHKKLRELSGSGLVPQFIDRSSLAVKMSYVEGLQLTDPEISGNMSSTDINSYLHSAADTLAEMHLKRVYHGDPCIENALFCKDRSVWTDLETPLNPKDEFGCIVNDAIIFLESVRRHFPKHYETMKGYVGRLVSRKVGDFISGALI